MKEKVLLDTLIHNQIFVCFKDHTIATGWLVRSEHNPDKFLLLNEIVAGEFSPSNIKYAGYLNGAMLFKGYGKYLTPIFENETPKQRLRRIKILKDKSLANLLEEDIELEENSKPKRFVVLDTGAIIDLETYGLLSWGSNHQYGIKVKGNKVYETYWRYGGVWEDDINEETLLGTIVYSSEKPLFISEASSASGYTKQPEYMEYGANLREVFFSSEESSNNV